MHTRGFFEIQIMFGDISAWRYWYTRNFKRVFVETEPIYLKLLESPLYRLVYV